MWGNKILFFLLIPTLLFARDPFLLPNKPKPFFFAITLHHITSQSALQYLKQTHSSTLSQQSFTINSNAQNTLWVYGKKNEIDTIQQILKRIDYKKPRILIRAKILLLDQHCLQKIGALITQHSNTALTIPLVKIANQPILDMQLNALTASGHARLVSTPSLVVNSGMTASIASGEELPYQEKSNEGNTSTTFKKALLELKVTPTKLNDKTINLALSLHQDKPSDRIINGTPAIATEQIVTNTTIGDHQTLILGGIYEQSKNSNRSGIPIISRIPLLGALFRNTHREDHRTLLVIFITPSVI